MEELLRAIALYGTCSFLLLAAYVGAYDMDKQLYNKQIERKIIQFKYLKWLFIRCKVRNEIYAIAFKHELIAILLFIITTILFIVARYLENSFGLAIIMFLIILYLSYVSIKSRHIQKNG